MAEGFTWELIANAEAGVLDYYSCVCLRCRKMTKSERNSHEHGPEYLSTLLGVYPCPGSHVCVSALAKPDIRVHNAEPHTCHIPCSCVHTDAVGTWCFMLGFRGVHPIVISVLAT